MTKLSKEVFVHAIVELLQEEGFDIKKTRISKANHDSYDCLTLSGIKDGVVRPAFNVDVLYNDYLNDKISLGDAVNMVKKVFKDNPINKSDAYVQKLKDFTYVKDNLIIEVYNASRNTEMLTNCVNKKYEDLAIVPKIYLGQHDDGQLVCAIPTSMLDDYCISNDELVELAVQNSQKIRPAKIMDFKDVVVSAYADHLIMSGQAIGCIDKKQLIEELKHDDDFKRCLLPTKTFECIVSNDFANYGAAVVFYPGVLEKLYKDIGEDFYLIPSSVHEMIIIPCSRAECNSLNEMVYQVNRDKQVMKDEDVLTDSLYVYNGKSMRKV